MLKPTDSYHSKNFTASLSDDPSGIWYLDVSCRTEQNGVPGKVIGHIPLCLTFKDNSDGSQEAVLSVMDDVEEEEQGDDKKNEEGSNIFSFRKK